MENNLPNKLRTAKEQKLFRGVFFLFFFLSVFVLDRSWCRPRQCGCMRDIIRVWVRLRVWGLWMCVSQSVSRVTVVLGKGLGVKKQKKEKKRCSWIIKPLLACITPATQWEEVKGEEEERGFHQGWCPPPPGKRGKSVIKFCFYDWPYWDNCIWSDVT